MNQVNDPMNFSTNGESTSAKDSVTAGVWREVLENLEKKLHENAMKTWFADAKLVSFNGDVFTISAPDETRQNVIKGRFEKDVCAVLQELFGGEIHLNVIVMKDEPKPEQPEEAESIIGDYTFDNFVVGASNREAHGYAKGVASRSTYMKESNPLFIHGQSGLGKTHLLYAIYNEVRSQFPQKKVSFITGEKWLSEFVDMIQTNTSKEFKEKYRTIDLLIIDDVHIFAKGKGVQEELFNTFNELFTYKKQIVFTSDKPPSQLDNMEERLTSRFQSGIVIDIKKPDFETKMAIIKSKAESKGVNLPLPILELMAENIHENVRQIEGMINRLLCYRDLNYSPAGAPSEEIILKLVRDVLANRSDIVPTPAVIIKEVCTFYDIREEDIRGTGRVQKYLLPRNIAIYLIREMTSLSLNEIGREFSGRHHTSVLNSLNSIDTKIKKDKSVKAVIEDVRNNINAKYEA